MMWTVTRMVVAALTISMMSVVGEAQEQRPTDAWLTDPVDRRAFEAYLQFFTYASDLPFTTEVLGMATEEGVRHEHLRFQSTPGTQVTALLYHPPGIEVGDAPVIVYLHGGGPSGKDGGRAKRWHRFLARAGIGVLAIDMLHFGERNEGLFTTFDEIEKHERLYNNESVYLAWVQQTVKDVSRSFDFLVEERGVAPGRIGIAGLSRGGVLAAIAGGADDRFGAVALLHAGHFDFYEDGHRAAACPANYIGRIAPRPLFLLNTETDNDFLLDSAILPLHRLAGRDATIRWTQGSHGFMNEADVGALAEWLRGKLR